MGCRCENRKRASDIERMRALAKAFAVSEGVDVALVRGKDGTYGFCAEGEWEGKDIIEYISRY